MRSLLIAVLAVFLTISCSKNKNIDPGPPPVDETAFMNTMEKELWTSVNDYRKSKGLPEFKPNEYITKQSRNHALEISQGAFPGDGFETRLDNIRTHMAINGGEQISCQFTVSESEAASTIMNSWKSKHPEYLEKDYTHAGVGTFSSSSGKHYGVMTFVWAK